MEIYSERESKNLFFASPISFLIPNSLAKFQQSLLQRKTSGSH